MTRSNAFYAGVIRGAAELPLIGAYLAREAVAVVGLDAAVTGAACGCAGFVARGVRRADNQSIVAINSILAVFCRV